MVGLTTDFTDGTDGPGQVWVSNRSQMEGRLRVIRAIRGNSKEMSPPVANGVQRADLWVKAKANVRGEETPYFPPFATPS